MADAEGFTCPFCSAVSHNPNDLTQRYCGRCRVFVDDAVIRREALGACRGHTTTEATDQMEHCLACGCEIRSDLVDHHYFGFRAGCVWGESSDG